MNRTNILVVEDESIVAKDIQQNLKKMGYEVAGVCSSGEEAVKKASEAMPDLILMDIRLKGELSGIEAAEQIRESINRPVIFLTAYADEATLSKAKYAEPYGYIMKPFKEIDLKSAIEMAVHKHKKEMEVKKERDMLFSLVEQKDQAGVLFVKSNSRLVKVNTRDVLFIEALKDYVVINTTTDVKYTIHSTMKVIEKKLPASEFIRVHRSFIVNMDKIMAIENSNIILEHSSQKKIPIGGSYKEDMVRRINMI